MCFVVCVLLCVAFKYCNTYGTAVVISFGLQKLGILQCNIYRRDDIEIYTTVRSLFLFSFFANLPNAAVGMDFNAGGRFVFWNTFAVLRVEL